MWQQDSFLEAVITVYSENIHFSQVASVFHCSELVEKERYGYWMFQKCLVFSFPPQSHLIS